MDVGVLMKDNGAVGVNILTKVYCSREASDVLQIKLVFVTAFRYKFGSFIQQVVAVGLNNHEFFGQAKVASFRRVVVGPGSCNNGPFYVEVYRVVLQLPDVFGQFSAVSVFSVSECNLVLIKSLFKSSFGQSNVVLRGRFVVCSGDLCVVDNAERQAIVVERALDNFQNKPTCRLINPAKSEIGCLSKHILENINTTVRQKNWT